MLVDRAIVFEVQDLEDYAKGHRELVTHLEYDSGHMASLKWFKLSLYNWINYVTSNYYTQTVIMTVCEKYYSQIVDSTIYEAFV